jgi:pimeloyl-ACP methyl ester carboxylesterase
LKIFDSIVGDQKDNYLCLIGAGLGGLLAISYIARYPKKIFKLALFATPLIRGTRNSELQKQVDYFWAMAFQNPSWGIKKMHERMINTFAKKGRIEDYQLFPKSSPEISLIHSKIIMDTEVRPLLSKIRIPTLILEGEKTFRPKENIETMKKIPNSKVYIFKDAYLISLKEAEKFNRILEEFFIHGAISE